MDDKQLRRAGLDYREFAAVRVYPDLESYLQECGSKRVFAVSTKGNSRYDCCSYRTGDTFIFGPETRGLPAKIRNRFKTIRIPMLKQSRSLNLSNAVSIVIYEAIRQSDFEGFD